MSKRSLHPIMTIKCQICGRSRDQAFIGLHRRVFFCLDNPECVAKGRTWQRIKEALPEVFGPSGAWNQHFQPQMNTDGRG